VIVRSLRLVAFTMQCSMLSSNIENGNTNHGQWTLMTYVLIWLLKAERRRMDMGVIVECWWTVLPYMSVLMQALFVVLSQGHRCEGCSVRYKEIGQQEQARPGVHAEHPLPSARGATLAHLHPSKDRWSDIQTTYVSMYLESITDNTQAQLEQKVYASTIRTQSKTHSSCDRFRRMSRQATVTHLPASFQLMVTKRLRSHSMPSILSTPAPKLQANHRRYENDSAADPSVRSKVCISITIKVIFLLALLIKVVFVILIRKRVANLGLCGRSAP
jgi:hypothetical protein